MVENLNKKQFLTYDEQITFLEEKKGLMISDKEYAKKILLKIGYFPLINGYKEVFKQSINDQFQKGTTFKDIYELYSFDNELRNIFLKYILMAERNIKSSLSYHFCKEYGDLQSDYLSVNNYDYTGKKKNVINKMVKIMSGQLRYDSDYVYTLPWNLPGKRLYESFGFQYKGDIKLDYPSTGKISFSMYEFDL